MLDRDAMYGRSERQRDAAMVETQEHCSRVRLYRRHLS